MAVDYSRFWPVCCFIHKLEVAMCVLFGLYLGPGTCSLMSGAARVLKVICLFSTFMPYSKDLLPFSLKSLSILHIGIKVPG